MSSEEASCCSNILVARESFFWSLEAQKEKGGILVSEEWNEHVLPQDFMSKGCLIYSLV